MKRKRPHERERRLALARERTRHNLESKRKAANLRRERQRAIEQANPRRPTDTGQWVRVFAPRRFGLEREATRTPLVKFLGNVRRLVWSKKKNVLIDFSATEKMHPSGTLLFVAELERIRRARGDNSCFRCKLPRDIIVRQVLQQVGILDLLRCEARQNESDFAANVRHWKYATGLEVDGAKFETFQKAFEGKIAAPLLTDFYAGITEAMTNSIHHAYEAERGDGIGLSSDTNRWWMFSQQKDNNLSVAFCDTGIGIPRSLLTSGHWSESLLGGILKKLGFAGNFEGELVRSAIELHKSRTGSEHRGRGLGEILDVVRNSGRGNFTILSNRGFYRYDSDSKTEVIMDFDDSIMGTLILWNVPVDHGAHS
jgi:hypothetical protein